MTRKDLLGMSFPKFIKLKSIILLEDYFSDSVIGRHVVYSKSPQRRIYFFKSQAVIGSYLWKFQGSWLFSVCKSLKFFLLIGCIVCDPLKHKKHGSVKVKLYSGRQSYDS